MDKKQALSPLLWGSLILLFSEVLTFLIAFQQRAFYIANQIASPDLPVHFPLAYFFIATAVMGIVLFLIPASKLRLVLRVLFTVVFLWGVLAALAFFLPLPAASLIAVAASLFWLLRPQVWLHNLLLAIALASMGSLVGFLLSPWTSIFFMLAISVYDALAVRFGYMLWLAKRLSEPGTIPAFVIPRQRSGWKLDLRRLSLGEEQGKSGEREFSVLGGGDIGFPLILVVSVFFVHGFTSSLIVAGSALVGVMGAYLIQLFWLEGRPMPALPPIFLASLAGFLTANLAGL